MLIRRATLLDGRQVDVRTGARITEVAAALTPTPGEEVLDAAGGTVIPGLHDHHVHLHAAAAAVDSVAVGPADVGDRHGLASALAAAAPDAEGWVRAVGYHDAVAGPLDRNLLDALTPPVPVRVQHRSGVLWTVNSAGLRALGLADHPDGRLRSADAVWSARLPRREVDLTALSGRLARYGITGLTDATPDLAMPATLTEQVRQRVHLLAPGKRILHDDALDLDELARWIGVRHDDGVPVALHCVTAAQLVVALAALRLAGTHPRDRIEHAAVVPDDAVPDLADSGVTVVTQPNFVGERGDQYAVEVPESEHHELWRVRTLLAAGVPVALSTDAPFGRPDPWAVMRAAVARRTPTGRILGSQETVSAATALAMFLGSAGRPAVPRAVAPGEPGDLCVLSAPPDRVLTALDAGLVAATVVAGEVVWSGS